ncbi:MAG: DegT/DnrJ/EryC1/StrS family aminotransferase [Candidatus Protistobacter heckmanni]|nr:DegT/DnrJ/EryC1/StrS family aminotransferase [Candidatus Protistobacter heckmanni]
MRDELHAALDRVGESGMYIMGDELRRFEEAAAAYCGTRYALGVADGSDAIFLALKALGVGPGDEVITAPNSFIATAWTVVAAGAKPVFVDVTEDFNIDPALIEAAITPRTKAIIPVHLTGRVAQMDRIAAIAKKHGLHIVEDAAQAIGARLGAKRSGALGDLGCFSLHPLKNLGLYGDGGLITTDNEALYASLLKLRNHGLRNRDECEIWGFNSRLDSLQAAFASVKLPRLDAWNSRCREIAGMYRAGLKHLVQTPKDRPEEESVYHNFVIITPRRDELMQHMLSLGVESRVHYPIPIHLQQAAKDLGYREGDFPVTERLAKQMISLPIYPELEAGEIAQVIASIVDFFKS